MAKIAVMGPRELLLDVLAHIEHLGILQIDQESKPGQLKELETVLQSVALDRDSLGRRFLYENLLQKIDGLLVYLPPGVSREYFLDNGAIAQFLSEVIDKHLESLRTLDQEQKQIGQALKELEASRLFLDAIAPLFPKNTDTPILDYIGISIRDPKALAELQQQLQQETGKPVAIDTVEGPHSELLGVITAEHDVADLIRKKLSRDLVSEHQLPKELAGLPMPEKIGALAAQRAALHARQQEIATELATFAHRWQGVYSHVRGW
ncbi:MAG: hypothetical protein KJ555_03550, partial [Proteobacteria bacterium]|nr:hypothetical protein [Pseudomonadota bacterium]